MTLFAKAELSVEVPDTFYKEKISSKYAPKIIIQYLFFFRQMRQRHYLVAVFVVAANTPAKQDHQYCD